MSKENDFIKINIDIIGSIKTELPFDVYIQRTKDRYTKLFPKGEIADFDRIAQYKTEKHVQTFSVKAEDHQQYLVFVEDMAKKSLEGDGPPNSARLASVMSELVEATLLELNVNTQMDPGILGAASTVVQGCIQILSTDPKRFADIIRLMSRHPSIIRHSISCSIFSILLAKAAGMGSNKSLMTIGMGAFLHDIGMTQLPYDGEDLDDFTPEQWKEVKEHPELGKKLVENLKPVTQEVRQIILQHHEQPNGNGYPNKLSGPHIFPPAKVIAICDTFVTLSSKRPYREDPIPPREAISMMRDDLGKFDQNLLKTFEGVLLGKKS